MQSSLRSGGRESAETVPERGDGELEQRAKLPSTFLSPTIFEEFSPRQSAKTSFSFPLEASGISTIGIGIGSHFAPC